MAKFLSYEDRLEIESSLKAHMTFTEIGKSWEGTGLPSPRRSGIIPWRGIPGTGVTRTTHASTGKTAGGKKCAGHRIAGIRSYPSASSANPPATATVNSTRKRYACTGSNRPMPATAAGNSKSARSPRRCMMPWKRTGRQRIRSHSHGVASFQRKGRSQG